MESFSKLQAAIQQAAIEVPKIAAGNKSAGERLRKQMQEVKQLAQTVRRDTLALYRR